MLDNAIPQGFEDAVELRRKNRETVVKYMNTKGQDRLRRHELSSRTAVAVYGPPIPARPSSFVAKTSWPSGVVAEMLPGLGVVQHQGLRDRRSQPLLGRVRRPRQDPLPRVSRGYYENHFLHSFELDDGKIKRNREFMNVFQQLRALSIPVPQIKREGIPT